MKNLFVLILFLPFVSKAQFTVTNNSTTSLVELRTGTWPLDLQRIIKNTDTCYVLQFRDQQVTSDVNMATLRFGDIGQLRWFEKGLTTLKTSGSNGETLNYKDYTLKRMDVKSDKDPKKSVSWYLVICGSGPMTNFQQSEADRMIAAIKTL